MNKQSFIAELKRLLDAKNIGDADEIIAEYEEHFARKAADGYTEAEIAAKLGDPAEIAGEYEPVEGPEKRRKAGFFKVFGFGLLDICTAILFICALAWAAALAVCALALIVVGVCLIAAPAFPANTLIIPYMPYVAGALFGAALIALGVAVAMLTIYCAILIKKSTAAFARWQKNSLSAKRTLPYVIFPLVEGKPRRVLRRINLIAVAAAALLLSAGFALMATQAGAFEFWHVWGWFNYIG